MAAKQVGISKPGNVQEWIGTAAERTAVNTTSLGAGSTYWETDNKAGYVWDGAAWQAVA